MIDKKKIGLNVRELRENNKMDILEFSNIIDISEEKLMSIEIGKSLPTLKIIVDICNNFNINIDKFIENCIL